MSEECFLPSSLRSDVFLKDSPRETQDNGKVRLGGGFSPLFKVPASKLRQQADQFEPRTILETR
jgi:hypothetical protein